MRLRKHKRNISQRQFSARLGTACRRIVLLLCVVPEQRNVRTVKGAQPGFAAAVPSGLQRWFTLATGVLTAYARSKCGTKVYGC